MRLQQRIMKTSTTSSRHDRDRALAPTSVPAALSCQRALPFQAVDSHIRHLIHSKLHRSILCLSIVYAPETDVELGPKPATP